MSNNIEVKSLLKDAGKAPMPVNILPMSFKIAQAAFDNEAWQFEIKWDGFRILSYSQPGKIELRSRNNKSFDTRFSIIKQELQSLQINAVLDGEVVIVDDKGCADFSSLMEGQTDCLVYYVFDILWYNGYS